MSRILRFTATSQAQKRKDGMSFTVTIESSDGNTFRYNETFETTLSARMYINATEVTSDLEAYRFRWTRVSKNPTSDAAWNALSKAIGHKSVTIGNDDVYGRSVFVCEVDLDGYEYEGD